MFDYVRDHRGEDKLVDKFEASLRPIVGSRLKRIAPEISIDRKNEERTGLRSKTTGKTDKGVLKNESSEMLVTQRR